MGGGGASSGGAGRRYFRRSFPAPRKGRPVHRMHWYLKQLHKQILATIAGITTPVLQTVDRLEAGFHRFMHGKWGTIEDSYNDKLRQWLRAHPTASADDLFRQVGQEREMWIDLYEEYLLLD